jgi:ABC-2 type transport system permease protein
VCWRSCRRSRFQDLYIISYGAYFGTISTIVILFCAAQAPELFGRDQRHGVLPLYFARALRRSDYALARIAGFIAALLILSLAPMVILFLGRVLLSPDVVGGIVKDLPSIPPILAQAFLTAGLLGSLSMLVAAFSPRRAYATAGIIALFVIPSILAQVVGQLGSSAIGNILTLASPTSVLDGTNAILFNASLGPGFFFIDVPSWSYFATAGVGIAGAIAITVRRFLRIAT